jgi:hypothetical protein
MKITIKVKTTKSLPLEFYSPISVEESGRTKYVTGTLITEGISRNNFYYNAENLQEIADSVVGVPIYFGTETRVNPNTGKLTANMHKKGSEAVGRIVSAIIDKVSKKIKFRAEIFESFADKIKRGWGVSIGAKGLAEHVVDAAGRVITKLFGITVNHVQLLSPETQTGVQGAEIENVEESVWFEQPKIDKKVIAAVIAALQNQNEV